MRIIGILCLFLVIFSCKTRFSNTVKPLKDSLNFNNYSEDKNILNVNVNECDWVYKGKLLSKKKIQKLKIEIVNKTSTSKITAITSVPDSLKKYNSGKTCLVILE